MCLPLLLLLFLLLLFHLLRSNERDSTSKDFSGCDRPSVLSRGVKIPLRGIHVLRLRRSVGPVTPRARHVTRIRALRVTRIRALRVTRLWALRVTRLRALSVTRFRALRVARIWA